MCQTSSPCRAALRELKYVLTGTILHVQMVGVLGIVPSLIHSPFRLFLHVLYYHTKAITTNVPLVFVQVTVFSFSTGHKIQPNDGARPRQVVKLLGCLRSATFYWAASQENKSCANKSVQRADSCRRRGLPVPEDTAKGVKCMCTRTEQHPKITHLSISRVPSW